MKLFTVMYNDIQNSSFLSLLLVALEKLKLLAT